jgi:hypothetical protein
MGQAFADYFQHMAFAFDWWVAVIASLPGPIWVVVMVLGLVAWGSHTHGK